MANALVFCALLATAHASYVENVNKMRRGAAGAAQEQALLQTYNTQLSGSATGAQAKGVTPVTRVVNLLKEMQATLNKEQEEDEALYDKLACWCNNNKYEKTGTSDAATAKIADLEATIEMLTARSSELKTKIKELETDVAADKAALAEASKLREKQLKEFHAMELDNIAALENLKSAIVVLGRHQGAAFPQVSLSLLEVSSSIASQVGSLEPWGSSDSLLQDSAASDWPAQDVATVKNAIKTANAFLQAHHGEAYMPSYAAQSGEIFGILKQLQEEMKASLSEAQKTEAARAATFAELRSAKTSEIEAGEKMAETKEDELAKTDMDLAEAKEDLGQTQAALAEDQKFLGNLEKTCAEADANFAKRKNSRLAEIEAVSQTIEILSADDAKDAMDTTFSLVQTDSEKNLDKRRRDAAKILRLGAAKSKSPELSMLASSVELDAFTKVKAMIDKMISTLKMQQADEVKKNDWCNAELQENEMTTAKTNDLKSDLEAKIGELESTIKTLADEIEKAKLDIANLQVSLQRASENRKQENMDFQKTVADQMVTAEILAKALDKLATFYDEAAFAQTQAKKVMLGKQTPPVAQKEYKKSSGSTGVMSMIEKLIYDTKEITAESKKSESEAQAAYEALVADTNASIADLTKEITSKTKAKAQAKKDLSATSSDKADAEKELENLGKYNADLHGECDYVMKNFGIRQKARSEEIESLQQAKQILSGASLS
jgi:chromosome segregation ATPase